MAVSLSRGRAQPLDWQNCLVYSWSKIRSDVPLSLNGLISKLDLNIQYKLLITLIMTSKGVRILFRFSLDKIRMNN